MRPGASASRTILHFRLVHLRITREFLQISSRQFVADDQQYGLLNHQCDRLKIDDRIVKRLSVKCLVLSKSIKAAQHKLIAIGCRLRHPNDSGHAACTADVLDDDLLTQDLGKPSAENSR